MAWHTYLIKSFFVTLLLLVDEFCSLSTDEYLHVCVNGLVLGQSLIEKVLYQFT